MYKTCNSSLPSPLEINTASRGAARLRLYGNRSHDGSNAAVTRIARQQWHIDAQQPLNSIVLDSVGSSRLTGPTLPASLKQLSLQSHLKHTPVSADSNALAANAFLQRCHPDVDVPEWLLSETLFDNAKDLGKTAQAYADTLDAPSSLPTAVLGPLVVDDLTTYFVISVGGKNRDQLLMHRLQVAAHSLSATAKGKQKEALIPFDFHPASRCEMCFDTPILQLATSCDRQKLALRTYTSTIFFALQSDENGAPSLEELADIDVSESLSPRHQDICFCPTDSNLAATVDSAGHIDLHELPATGKDTHKTRRLEPQFEEQPELLRRICFSPSSDVLFALSTHSLFNLTIPPASEAERTVRAQKVMSAPFCLATKQAGRFFSLAMAYSDSNVPVLAACSSELVHWFDVETTCKPLFSLAHHRGDDASLMLTPTPHLTPRSVKSSATWVLSSFRNRLHVAYTVHSSERHADQQRMLVAAELVEQHRFFVLDNAPVEVPTALPDTGKHGSAPVFFDVSEVVDAMDKKVVSMLEVSDRGALFMQFLQPRLSHTGRAPPPPTISITRHESVTKSSLYTNVEDVEKGGPRGAVETRTLPLQNLYEMIMSDRFNRSPDYDAERICEVLTQGSGCLLDPATLSKPKQATLRSLGQAVKEAFLLADNGKDRPVPRNALTAEMVHNSELVRWALEALQMDLENGYVPLEDGKIERAWLESGKVQEDEFAAGLFEWDSFQHWAERHTISYMPSESTLSTWPADEQQAFKESLEYAGLQMAVDTFLETQWFLHRDITLLDGSYKEWFRPDVDDERRSTNWTPAEHQYEYTNEWSFDIEHIAPPPQIGSVELAFFDPLMNSRHLSTTAERDGSGDLKSWQDPDNKYAAAHQALDSLLPRLSTTARLLLCEWQRDEDPTKYVYNDPYEGLNRLPRVSRSTGPTVRARSRSFSLASSGASSAGHSLHQNRAKKKRNSMTPAPLAPPTPSAPPALAPSKRRKQATASQPAPSSAGPSSTVYGDSRANTPLHVMSSPQPDQRDISQFASSQIAATQIEPGKFGARKAKRKKPRASGF